MKKPFVLTKTKKKPVRAPDRAAGSGKKWFVRLALVALLLVAVAWLTVSWIEAEKEVRILCSMIRPGQPHAHVLRTLDTGNYLRYTVETAGGRQTVRVSSPYNLGTTACTVTLVDGAVAERVTSPDATVASPLQPPLRPQRPGRVRAKEKKKINAPLRNGRPVPRRCPTAPSPAARRDRSAA